MRYISCVQFGIFPSDFSVNFENRLKIRPKVNASFLENLERLNLCIWQTILRTSDYLNFLFTNNLLFQTEGSFQISCCGHILSYIASSEAYKLLICKLLLCTINFIALWLVISMLITVTVICNYYHRLRYLLTYFYS